MPGVRLGPNPQSPFRARRASAPPRRRGQPAVDRARAIAASGSRTPSSASHAGTWPSPWSPLRSLAQAARFTPGSVHRPRRAVPPTSVRAAALRIYRCRPVRRGTWAEPGAGGKMPAARPEQADGERAKL